MYITWIECYSKIFETDELIRYWSISSFLIRRLDSITKIIWRINFSFLKILFHKIVSFLFVLHFCIVVHIQNRNKDLYSVFFCPKKKFVKMVEHNPISYLLCPNGFPLFQMFVLLQNYVTHFMFYWPTSASSIVVKIGYGRW